MPLSDFTEPNNDPLKAVVFLAILSYPEKSGEKQRNEFINAAYALSIKHHLKSGKLQKGDIDGPWLKKDNRDLYGKIKKAFRRIQNRRIPSASLYFFLKAGVSEDEIKNRLYSTMKKTGIINPYSHNISMAKKNITSRVKNESKPVVHFAIALWIAIMEATLKDENRFLSVGMYCFLEKTTWVNDAIRRAALYRKYFREEFSSGGTQDPKLCEIEFPRP